ncbi:hypothetical protein GCM10020358_83730 [Amorphoplanes nipponensis]
MVAGLSPTLRAVRGISRYGPRTVTGPGTKRMVPRLSGIATSTPSGARPCLPLVFGSAAGAGAVAPVDGFAAVRVAVAAAWVAVSGVAGAVAKVAVGVAVTGFWVRAR